jgi:hypothetical protein
LEVEGADVMQVSDDHLLLEDGRTTTNVDSPEKVHEKKRQRKDRMSDGVVKNAVKQFSLSVSSSEEDRQE